MNTGIPFKQSLSCIILWSHTHLCWSSFFSAQAQSGKRSEQHSYREAVWPSTPILLGLQFKERNEIQAGCGDTVGFKFGPSPGIVISSVLPNPWAFKVLSLIHSFSTLWTLNRKTWHFRTRLEWQVSPKFRDLIVVHKMLHHQAYLPVTPSPETLPLLALPSFQDSNTSRMLLLHVPFPPPAKLVLRFLPGLIQIPALLLEFQLSQSHHSVSHIPCSSFPHSP